MGGPWVLAGTFSGTVPEESRWTTHERQGHRGPALAPTAPSSCCAASILPSPILLLVIVEDRFQQDEDRGCDTGSDNRISERPAAYNPNLLSVGNVRNLYRGMRVDRS